ncbi:A/G-specific adenine glycosylase [Polymorphum gilvum]|nr:A/G-specific adenine glycosylase [Polymorphum gilvum]
MIALPSAADLLDWYDRHARDLPWRIAPDDRRAGIVPDPYHVWLSEIMLQQTTVAAVRDYYRAFLARWPNVEALAAADLDDVLRAWAGLGYYSRARNLKACAEMVARDHGGRFPDSEDALRALPGIGAYTAAAIAAIAFDARAAVVDGNVERVMARLFRIETPLPDAKPEIRAAMDRLTPADRPGDFAQAVMDLGATLCTPRRPACALCPWSQACAGRHAGVAETLPLKAPKKAKPTRRGAAFVARRSADGAILLRKRPAKGLLGGMAEVPGTPWSETFDPSSAAGLAPFPAGWRVQPAPVRHIFTHFHLELSVLVADLAEPLPLPDAHWWSAPGELAGEALPTVMRKVVAAGTG